MASTLQKEYALIYYLRTVLGQTNNNGYLNELYNEKNLKSILETLINNKIKNQTGVDVEQLITTMLRQINTEVLTNPSYPKAKFNILPNNPVSALELYVGKTLDSEIVNSKERIFIDDITDAKNGMAGYFVSLFTIKNMVSGDFAKMVTWNNYMSQNAIRKRLFHMYKDSTSVLKLPNSEILKDIEPFVQKIYENDFTYENFSDIELFIKAYYRGSANKIAIENGINAAIKKRAESEGTDKHGLFETKREQRENEIRGKILSSAKIKNFFDSFAEANFTGTMKYTRDGNIDGGESSEKVIQIALTKQNRVDKENVDRFTRFVDVLNKLLDIESMTRESTSLPHVRTGTYRAGSPREIKTVLLTEEQYHVLFPEYFITVGIIKEKTSAASELGGAQMKSGDEVTNAVDSYTGEKKYEYDDEESYSSLELTVDRTPKLMLAKMLAIINGHPEDVPDVLTPSKAPNSTIYEMNRLLVRELCNTPYTKLRDVGYFIESGKLPESMMPQLKELSNLRMTYLATRQDEHREQAERNEHVKDYANVLSELARLANMHPEGRAGTYPQNNIIIKSGENTFILNNLPAIVNMMISHTTKGEFVASTTCTGTNYTQNAVDFLIKKNLVTKVNQNEYMTLRDTNDIRQIIEGLDWASIGTYHDVMLSEALRNCGYVYSPNGWIPMNTDRLRTYKFSFITEVPRVKDVDYDKTKMTDLIDHMVNIIKPYMLKVRDTNTVIKLVENTCLIPDLPEVKVPEINDSTMEQADSMLQMFGTDNSTEEADKLAEQYYSKFVIPMYEEAVETARKTVRKKLSDKNMLTDVTEQRLIQRCNHNGSLSKIVMEIFEGKKNAVTTNTASNYIQQEVRDIFTLGEAIISLYNGVLSSVKSSNPTIASGFQSRNYITSDDVKRMAQGTVPNGKKYNENGSECQNDFLLNAYLIDILFEAVYLLMVQFNLPPQNQYTVQNVINMTDVTEMKRYISANLDIKLRDKVHDSGLITRILNRLDSVLYRSHMVTMLAGLFTTHPEVARLTSAEYSKINGQTIHMTTEKTMANELANRKKSYEEEIQERKRQQRVNLALGI